jgi:hypothetical protein
MYKIKDSGDREEYETGARRDIQEHKGRFDFIPPATLRAIAIHYEMGCAKYGPRNWEKGIPLHTYFNSALRHQYQVIDGKNDENHLMAAIWNLICAYETMLRIQNGVLPKHLYDLPYLIILPDPYEG